MGQLPITLCLTGRKVVVAGGGLVAARKAEAALRAGAEVLVVAPSLDAEFLPVPRLAGFSFRAGQVQASDLAGAMLVYITTGDAAEDIRLGRPGPPTRGHWSICRISPRRGISPRPRSLIGRR